MSHLFVCFLSERTFLYAFTNITDVLSNEDILVIHNLLMNNFINQIMINKYLRIALITIFTAKSYSLINILLYCRVCGSIANRIENVAFNRLSLR